MRNRLAPRIVAVIFSRADLQRALRIRLAPDLFELRLDAAISRLEEVDKSIRKLRAPLILTARHPQEGGANNLTLGERRALLQRFLPTAAYVDIELRSASPLAAVLKEARARNIRIIISFHDFTTTPSPARLDEIAHAARTLGADIFKVATRTDTAEQLATLFDFFERHRAKARIAAMGIGKLGRTSRLELARRGSVLNYVHLGTPQSKGQLSFAQLRQHLGKPRASRYPRGF